MFAQILQILFDNRERILVCAVFDYKVAVEALRVDFRKNRLHIENALAVDRATALEVVECLLVFEVDFDELAAHALEAVHNVKPRARPRAVVGANADVLVSVHMNSFSSLASGAQVFYAKGNEQGERLASSVQNALSYEIENTKNVAKVGDFYVLNCTDCAGILVECGFLSNPKEEAKLCDEDYQQKFCETLLFGILNYFGM